MITTLQEMRDWLRLDGHEEDDLVTGLIVAAQQHVEFFTRRICETMVCVQYLDTFTNLFELENGPVLSVESITYVDLNGVTQTIDPNVYRMDTTRLPHRIRVAYGQSYPITRGDANNICITYRAGYGDASLVPDALKTAVRMLAAHWYENREPVVVGTITAKLPFSIECLLWQYRIFSSEVD